jgi:hypothetical protein
MDTARCSGSGQQSATVSSMWSSHRTGRRGHRDGAVELGLVDVVGDDGEEGGVAVLLELALDQVCAPAAAGGDVGHADAFCRS